MRWWMGAVLGAQGCAELGWTPPFPPAPALPSVYCTSVDRQVLRYERTSMPLDDEQRGTGFVVLFPFSKMGAREQTAS